MADDMTSTRIPIREATELMRQYAIKLLKIRTEVHFLKAKEHASNRWKTLQGNLGNLLSQMSYLRSGATFSHALTPSALFLLLLFTPSFRPPSRRESGQEREYQIQTLSSSSFSTPLAQNNSSNPIRVPESYRTEFCVYVCAHVDVCAASGLDQDTLLCTAGSGSSRQLPRNVETRYIRPRSGSGLLKILVPKTRAQKPSGADRKCSPPSVCLQSSLSVSLSPPSFLSRPMLTHA